MRQQTLLKLILASALMAPGTVLAAEVHAVGIYEVAKEAEEGTAKVHVDRPGESVSLILAAYDETTWRVTYSKETTITQVILGGGNSQTVEGLEDSIKVSRAYRDPSRESSGWLRPTHRSIGREFQYFVYQCHGITGAELSSFHGHYRAPAEPILIDAIQDDPRLASSYPQPVPLEGLPEDARDITFEAIHSVAVDRMRVARSLGTFRLDGPIESSLKPLSGVGRITYSPETKSHFGISGHEVVQVDLKANKVDPMALGDAEADFSWPSDITYDTKRKRVFLGSSGGGGNFYAYDTKAKNWSVLCKRPGSIDSFVYSPKDDCIYGVLLEHSEDGNVPSLATVNPQGALVSTWPLPMDPGSLGGGPGVTSTQVVLAGNYLAIVASPDTKSGEQRLNRTLIYLVDPKTKKVWLTSKETTPPVASNETVRRVPANKRPGRSFRPDPQRNEPVRKRRIILPSGIQN